MRAATRGRDAAIVLRARAVWVGRVIEYIKIERTGN
jgi:hypothetical protein